MLYLVRVDPIDACALVPLGKSTSDGRVLFIELAAPWYVKQFDIQRVSPDSLWQIRDTNSIGKV
jgi:hypothetical protein